MRLIIYCVMNKKTQKRVFTNCNRRKVENFLASLEDKEDYCIGYKWTSI